MRVLIAAGVELGSLMQSLRKIPHFVRVLVGLFLVAQFAGVVTSPLASALGAPTVIASQAHDHPVDDHGDGGTVHHRGDHGAHHADHCCALHAFFAGILPAAIVVETVAVAGQRLTAKFDGIVGGVDPDGLDRPPRPLL
jgi:hypothetical protein